MLPFRTQKGGEKAETTDPSHFVKSQKWIFRFSTQWWLGLTEEGKMLDPAMVPSPPIQGSGMDFQLHDRYEPSD